ncbi:MAG: 4-alpha-glucanotransferase, partial [Gammaproteobacteria bacterium]
RPDSVASLNTHDTPTLAGYWEGLDLDDRVTMGLLDPAELPAERQKREARKHTLVQFLEEQRRLAPSQAGLGSGARELPAIAKACLTYLAASPARVVTVNLEDLWEERLPQNVPGTGSERPNWRRKARYPLEEFCQLPQVLDTLKAVDAERGARPKTK